MHIASVTVTHGPDLKLLESQLTALRPQVAVCWMVDNASPAPVRAALQALCDPLGVRLLPMAGNAGLAAAQNHGIRQALAGGAEAVLLMDQDSIPTPGMVATLQRALQSGRDIAAAGPAFVDTRSGHLSYFLLDAPWWPVRWQPEAGAALQEVAFLIASGTLLRSEPFVQGMTLRDDLFIDHVDTEWCFRLRAGGWRLLGVPAAVLHHRLGDAVRAVWWLRWRHLALHGPLRYYYMVRNTLCLLGHADVPWRWRMFLGFRAVMLVGYALLFLPPRGQRLRMALRGLRHGLSGRSGRLDDEEVA